MHDVHSHLRALDQGRHVLRVLQKSRVDQWGIVGVGAGQRDAAPAFRPHQRDVQRVAVPQVVLARVVVHDAGAQRQLNVGCGRGRVGVQKALGFGHVAGEHAGAFVAPFEDAAHDGDEPAEGEAKGVAVGLGAVNQHGGQVVVQVLPNAGQCVAHLNAVLLQVRGRADAGEHEQLRRAKGAG